MKLKGKEVLICDCEGTMPLLEKDLGKLFDDPKIQINTHLCRTQIGNFSTAVSGDGPIIVACTQEAPLFVEKSHEIDPEQSITYTNIREKAAWSSQGDKSLAKIKALIHEATLDAPMANSLSMKSNGSLLIYGSAEQTLTAAKQVSDRLSVTCIFKSDDENPSQPPRLMDIPIFSGKLNSIEGHLGAFNVAVDDYATVQVSSRTNFALGKKNKQVMLEFDLILDLSNGTPFVPGHQKRDGYFHIESNDSLAIQRALFDLTDLVGEFEKPRYIKYDKNSCVHSRSSQIGCMRCIDACPTSAIMPSKDEVEVNPYICAGCGNCASVCPTGAVSYQLPAGNFIFDRVKTLTETFHSSGGENAILLVHDTSYGEDMISAIAHVNQEKNWGLPANVIPFALNEITQIGFDFLSVALALGIQKIKLLASPHKLKEMDSLQSQMELMNTAMSGLGYGSDRVSVIDSIDPNEIANLLFEDTSDSIIVPGDFAPMGTKRSLINLALKHLHDHAPEQISILPLSKGAPFGKIDVDTSNCTLCLSCVGACPTGALKDNPEKPEFTFTETACVQCGLCQTICPESVISLVPRFNFREDARSAVIVKEEKPFQCIKCGDPFGVESSVNQMVEKLRNHSMYSDGSALERIKMCPDCRITEQFDDPKTPMASGDRPEIRTTDDYLKEREGLRAKAEENKKTLGLDVKD